ncbi:Bug family tripartite tricarboxylate transporter substrate binding protein [Aquabacter spiritensis]|uniref:Tripartite-type tricarboxylate transporter receptor subunit TctC n=1 Tax=Aquabacter spiritensis TaxID=933073 RepID=A0A4R3M4P3_9HYPH|nr:tripartite tricarboxylate transporter substrate binding protein [Aquabacter spiritensis]TCT06155.1 tripartite-type tricarboxylate transporter receptor subunit TctC [Aquabacter spiritensis]
MKMRAFIAGAGLALVLGCATVAQAQAQAQTYPDRLIKIVAPFPAGGVVDVLSRALGQELSKALGQPVIIENRPGAGGNIGAETVAKAPPDGYTLMMTSPGIQSINQFLYKKMPFDPETAFAPISLVADMPMLVVLGAASPYTTLSAFIAAAKAKPDGFNFGSAGYGTTGHLGMELFAYTAGIKLRHTPYKGAAPAVNDLLGGHIDGVVDNPPTVMAHIKSGALRALAVAGPERLTALPNVPTSTEAGLADWRVSSWFGLVAPAKTPPAIVDRLAEEVRKAIAQPAMRKLSDELGLVLVGDTPAAFEAVIKQERKKWGELIAKAGITLE